MLAFKCRLTRDRDLFPLSIQLVLFFGSSGKNPTAAVCWEWEHEPPRQQNRQQHPIIAPPAKLAHTRITHGQDQGRGNGELVQTVHCQSIIMWRAGGGEHSGRWTRAGSTVRSFAQFYPLDSRQLLALRGCVAVDGATPPW